MSEPMQASVKTRSEMPMPVPMMSDPMQASVRTRSD
jgi:hypothetical protein